MKLVVFLALVGAAAAFAPARVARTSRTAVNMAVEDMLGADVETAGVWDPFGYVKDGEETLMRRRAVEIKHGRVSMLAVVGYVMGDCYTFPGYLSEKAGIKFSDVPAGMGALTKVPAIGWAQIIAFCGVLELVFFKQEADKAPGDLAKFFWVRYDDEELKNRKLLSEIKNGRLAMMAIMGMMVQEMVTHQTTFEQIKAGNLSPFPDLSATL